MTQPFRIESPKRTYAGPKLSPYGKYKLHLKDDFKSRCGYTDCPDFWFGGSSTFHIDHFKPKSIYHDLVEDYNNLVYCCSHVNIAKKADESEYLDPCNVDYNEHFERDKFGNIIPKNSSPQAKYMHVRLKLYLKRYGAIWIIDQLYQKMKLLTTAIENLQEGPDKKELLLIMGEFGVKFTKYLEYLEAYR